MAKLYVTDFDLRFATEAKMFERMKPQLLYWQNEYSKTNPEAKYWGINHIINGIEMRCTKGNKVKMTFHNTNKYVWACTVDAIIDPMTLDYTLNYNGFYGEHKVLKREELNDEDRMLFDAMTAKSLWNNAHSIHKGLYPIWDKDMQLKFIGFIEEDSFEK